MCIDQTYTARGEFDTIARYSDLAGTELVGTSDYSYARRQPHPVPGCVEQPDQFPEGRLSRFLCWVLKKHRFCPHYDSQLRKSPSKNGSTITQPAFSSISGGGSPAARMRDILDNRPTWGKNVDIMLTQEKANNLMAMRKNLVDHSAIVFPLASQAGQFKVRSEEGQDDFIIDVNRKGKIKLSKCTYQERYAVIEVLVRLDLGGPPHENPDGIELPCPHVHLYKEGYGDKWAYPLPAGVFSDPSDLVTTFLDFLRYCNVQNIPETLPGLF